MDKNSKCNKEKLQLEANIDSKPSSTVKNQNQWWLKKPFLQPDLNVPKELECNIVVTLTNSSCTKEFPDKEKLCTVCK